MILKVTKGNIFLKKSNLLLFVISFLKANANNSKQYIKFVIAGEVFSEGGKDIVLSNYSASWKFHRKIAGKALRSVIPNITSEISLRK